jgi:hypothetical protein
VLEDDVLTSLRELLGAMELQTGSTAELLEIARLQRQRIEELEEAWSSLVLEVGNLSRRARLLTNMKAATLVTTCRKCGNDFAREAGPELCGPCWIALGKPERYLESTGA